MKITFNNFTENASLQIGDNAYFTRRRISGFASNPILIGEITGLEPGKITIASPVSTPLTDDFIMFSKNTSVNNSGMLGYYAEVKLNNFSDKKAELFSLSSEILQSSK